MDASTSHNRENWLFWLLSRPFTLVVRVGEGAQDHRDGWIKSTISPSDTMEASKPKKGRHYQPQQRNFVGLVTITTFHALCLGAGGSRDPSYELIKGEILSPDTMGASGRKLEVSTSHNRGPLLFWLQSRPFTLAAWVLEAREIPATS